MFVSPHFFSSHMQLIFRSRVWSVSFVQVKGMVLASRAELTMRGGSFAWMQSTYPPEGHRFAKDQTAVIAEYETRLKRFTLEENSV
jgi:hypothetical protein